MMTSPALRRLTPAILLALALPARAAQFEAKGSLIPVVPAASASGPVVPGVLGASALSSIPSLSIPALNAGAGLPGSAAALPTGARAPEGAAAAGLTLPAAASFSGPSDKGGAPKQTVGSEKKTTEQKLTETGKDLAPKLDEARKGETDPKGAGNEIERILEGGKGSRGTDTDAVPSSNDTNNNGTYAAGSGFIRASLPNPRDLYETARALAVERAQSFGVAADKVAFGEVTASMPAGEERTQHFSFYALVDGERRVKPILVTMVADHRLAPATPFSATVRSWDETMTMERPLFPQLSAPYYFNRGSEASPDVALSEARRALPGLGGGVSFTLRLEEIHETGEVDLWYRFYDNAGSQVAVNSRTGDTIVTEDATKRATVDHVIGRKTVDLLGSLAAGAGVFPLGAAVAQHWQLNGIVGYLAAWISVLLLGAAIKMVPVDSFRRVGRVIGFGAIISPILAFAFVGFKALAASLGLAAAAAGTLKNAASSPLDGGIPALYASALEAAQKAAVSSKLPAPEFVAARRGANGWTFDFKAGERLVMAFLPEKGRASAYAYGAFEAPVLGQPAALAADAFAAGDRYSARTALKISAKKLHVPEESLGLSLIALADHHGKHAELWYVSDTEDGRRFGVNARTRAQRTLVTGPSREDVQVSADGTASYKGRPWSQTEYNMTLSGAMDNLRRLGATVAQLDLFRRITDGHPIRGGGFNPWSGD